jgi:hypothetical protein
VDGLTAKIERKMKDLDGLHRKRLMVTFDDSEADKERCAGLQAPRDSILSVRLSFILYTNGKRLNGIQA